MNTRGIIISVDYQYARTPQLCQHNPHNPPIIHLSAFTSHSNTRLLLENKIKELISFERVGSSLGLICFKKFYQYYALIYIVFIYLRHA